MTAYNVIDSMENSLNLSCSEKNIIGKASQCKTRQKITKNTTLALKVLNNITADQVFHFALSDKIFYSQLQNVIANLERQLLKTKKTALQDLFVVLTANKISLVIEK